MNKTLVLLVLWQVGCAATAATEQNVGCGWTPDPEIHGAHLDDESSIPWTRNPDFKPRLRRTIEAAAGYWHTDNDVLYGWKIQLHDHSVHCTGTGGHVLAGCVDWSTLTIKLDVGDVTHIEATALVHEVGHIVLSFGDPDHWSPAWWDRERLEATYYSVAPECASYIPGMTPELAQMLYDTYGLVIRPDGCLPAFYADYYSP